MNGVFASNSKHRARVTPGNWSRAGPHATTADPEGRTPAGGVAMTWAQRLKRVFGIDNETCLACGRAMRIFACIHDPDVIGKILTLERQCSKDEHMGQQDRSRLDAVVAKARREPAEREQGYRARALTLYPWVCGRCAREFTAANLHELMVHPRDHDYDHNPSDGSNWELLCLYCHDNEHQRYVDVTPGGERSAAKAATHTPFAGLARRLNRD